jgi:hypothetical protein
LNEPTVPHSVVFPDLFHKAVLATFDQPHASSDGGAPLLKAADRRLGLVAALTAELTDSRVPSKVTHTIGDLLAQRVIAIACGHPMAMMPIGWPRIRRHVTCLDGALQKRQELFAACRVDLPVKRRVRSEHSDGPAPGAIVGC